MGTLSRSEERRVGKECRLTGVDLGGRRIIQAEDGIRDAGVSDWSSDVCSSDLFIYLFTEVIRSLSCITSNRGFYYEALGRHC